MARVTNFKKAYFVSSSVNVIDVRQTQKVQGDSSGNVSRGRVIKDLLIGDMRKDAHAAPGAAVFHLLRGKDMHMLQGGHAHAPLYRKGCGSDVVRLPCTCVIAEVKH